MTELVPLVSGVVLYVVLGQPVAVLLHELGHAAVALATTDEHVAVTLGADPSSCVAIGRLTVWVGVGGWSLWGGVPGFVTRDARLESGYARAAEALAGPLVTLVLLVGLLSMPRPSPLLEATVLVHGYGLGFQFLATVVPIQYPDSWGAYAGEDSDGRRALAALRDV